MPNTQQHTPGPWTPDPQTNTAVHARNPKGDANDYILVAECFVLYTPRETQQANARLIAAAPDLLAACEDLIQLWDDWAEHSTQLAEPLRRSLEMRAEQARQAVEKAKKG